MNKCSQLSTRIISYLKRDDIVASNDFPGFAVCVLFWKYSFGSLVPYPDREAAGRQGTPVWPSSQIFFGSKSSPTTIKFCSSYIMEESWALKSRVPISSTLLPSPPSAISKSAKEGKLKLQTLCIFNHNHLGNSNLTQNGWCKKNHLLTSQGEWKSKSWQWGEDIMAHGIKRKDS